MFADAKFIRIEAGKLKQVGCIVWSSSMSRSTWQKHFESQGYSTVAYSDRMELYK